MHVDSSMHVDGLLHMLTVYSTQGSPGASTLAVYLAAQWASSDREVALIEADPTAGSLSQKLGIQFTPGTASFVAAGKPVTAANLIEHTQDVLFNNFHAMPTPSGPSGARTVAEKFSRLGEELRDISDRELAIIVDGGRLTAQTRTSELTTSAAAVLVVSSGEVHLPSLEHMAGALVDDPTQPGPLGLVATVGPSPLTAAEWGRNHGLTMVGSVDLDPEHGTDLTMFMPRSKRKSRKLRGSVEKLADALYGFACPASTGSPRARLPANRPEISEDPAEADGAPTRAAPDDVTAEAPPPAASASPPSQSPVAAAMPSAPAQAYPQQPYPQQPYPQHDYPQPPYPQHDQPQQPYPQQPYPQPPYPQQPYPQHDQPQPPYPQQPYPQHDYPQQPYPQQPYPQQPYPQHDQPQPPYPQPAHEPPTHSRGGEADSPSPYGQPPPAEPPSAGPPAAPLAEMPAVPSGSFRSWAADLFGESAGGDPDEDRSRPGTGATA